MCMRYLFNVEYPCAYSLSYTSIGGHRNVEEEREKMKAAQMVAIERAQMAAKR